MFFLSHVIRELDPVWPGSVSLEIEPQSLIGHGDAANTFLLHVFNHLGTHMDAPYHFNQAGKKVVDLPAEAFRWQKPTLVDVPLEDEELLTPEHLHAFDLWDTDILLIRSGWEKIRHLDPYRYAHHGPGLGLELALYMQEKLPSLRAIMIDWLSLASYAKQEIGVMVHQVLAGQQHERAILGIEDAHLANLSKSPHWVIALPLRIDGIDGTPCTVVGED